MKQFCQKTETLDQIQTSSHCQFTGAEPPGYLVQNAKPADPDSVGPEWSPRFCVPNSPASGAGAAGPWAIM